MTLGDWQCHLQKVYGGNIVFLNQLMDYNRHACCWDGPLGAVRLLERPS